MLPAPATKYPQPNKFVIRTRASFGMGWLSSRRTYVGYRYAIGMLCFQAELDPGLVVARSLIDLCDKPEYFLSAFVDCIIVCHVCLCVPGSYRRKYYCTYNTSKSSLCLFCTPYSTDGKRAYPVPPLSPHPVPVS